MVEKWQDLLWRVFEEQVFTVESSRVLFNQYSDVDRLLDHPDASKIRRDNLRNYIESLQKPEILLAGEAPGPWGGRFTGIPFTGEKPLISGELPFSGKKSSLQEKPYSEYSGNIFWKTLLPYFQKFFIWNVVPLHPHKEGLPLSIRNPTKKEIVLFAGALHAVEEIMQPRTTIAIGRKAETALGLLGIAHAYVRHPSQSGATGFKVGIKKLMEKSYK